MWKERVKYAAPYLSALVFLSSIAVLFGESYRVLCIPLLVTSLNILIIRYIDEYTIHIHTDTDTASHEEEHDTSDESPSSHVSTDLELIRIDSQKSVEEKKNE